MERPRMQWDDGTWRKWSGKGLQKKYTAEGAVYSGFLRKQGELHVA